MMINKEHDQLAAAMADLKPSAHLIREDLRAIDMFTYIFRSTRVVKENGQVEGIWVLNINQNLAIPVHSRIVGLDQSVKLVKTLQSMFISCIAMKKFVLDEAFKCAEFREIPAKNSTTMH